MTALEVIQPGLLSLLQDRGRFAQAAIGLTTGGPMDPLAASLANRLLQNSANATLIEVSFGGLVLRARTKTQIAVTGATLPLGIDGKEQAMWSVIEVAEGEEINLGFSETGCRSYLAVRGGFDIPDSFGSSSTVVREGIGGLNGQRLTVGDELPIHAVDAAQELWLPPRMRPRYHHRATVRVIPGYQYAHFPRLEQRRFFGSEYTVTDRCDRMGYRLEGPAIACDIQGILSEGIAPGAIQIPADGQPIALLNDRQTIGGYPKIGCALSLDCAALGQLRPGDTVIFTPISEHYAHNALHLADAFERSRHLEPTPR
ncbi:biotin-dependent carboxyltransferase family protein [Congregibacter variabilis]|uniref:Biotin-dependent carboxyltransferase family protein n=1 Tax=Congregibacter variabilis TaxID=3081200 RepID=A0ABZ0I4A5_9GAMM|nr:biotin-dependent carboxyltransferase family protein [Congregibacter sp. IMCC43200]